MKKIKKSTIPGILAQYQSNNPRDTWEDFKNESQNGYEEVIATLKSNQGGICCYCEIDFYDSRGIRDDFRVEHFHPKSDNTNVENWNLDWENLFGCCHGGSDPYVLGSQRYIEQHKHRHSDVLKGDLVWDDEILNPLYIPAFPPLFEVANDGTMKAIEENCDEDTKRKAINSLDETKLNLNSPKLKEWRKAVRDNLRDEIDNLFKLNSDISLTVNEVLNAQLSKNSSGNYPPFFSTIRSYFESDAEEYLYSIGYDG